MKIWFTAFFLLPICFCHLLPSFVSININFLIFYIYMQQFLFWGCVAGSVGFSIEKNDRLRANVFIPWPRSICKLDFRIRWFAYLLHVALLVLPGQRRSERSLSIIFYNFRFIQEYTWSTSTKPWAWGERDARYFATATPTKTAAINAIPANANVK